MIEKLIGTLFLSREVSHREHLKTGSYAHHVALNEFYDGLLDVIDVLVENYQGRNGIIEDIPILTNDRSTSNIAKLLEYHLSLVEKMRYTAIDKDDAALQSIMDEVARVYLRTLYKLKQLA
jgi:hypothetical protein